MSLYEMTDFPELFKNTYWGGGQYNPKESEIIANRNKFAKDYELTSLWEKMEYYPGLPSLDHKEIYKTKSGKIILIYSPYNHESINRDRFNKEFKFKQIDNLYISYAHTFLKEFDDLDHLKRWGRSFKYFSRYSQNF